MTDPMLPAAPSSPVGSLAPDFTLLDLHQKPYTLSEACRKAPVLLVFYPGDFTPVCTKQLCDYRDNYQALTQFGIQIVGLSKDSGEKHQSFHSQFQFPFPLLTDPKNAIAKAMGCGSTWMLGLVSRAVILVDQNRQILYKHVEPTGVTRRSTDDLIAMLKDQKAKGRI